MWWNRFCTEILVPILASATRAFDAGIVARGDGELEAPSCRAEAKFEGCCKGREGLAKSSRPAFEGRLRHARCRHVLPVLNLWLLSPQIFVLQAAKQLSPEDLRLLLAG